MNDEYLSVTLISILFSLINRINSFQLARNDIDYVPILLELFTFTDGNSVYTTLPNLAGDIS